MPYPHAPAKNRLTILARANSRDTTIALPRSDRVVGTCSSPATSISLPHMRDVPCADRVRSWAADSLRRSRPSRAMGAVALGWGCHRFRLSLQGLTDAFRSPRSDRC
jgi:hypothetical protein